MTCDTAHRAPLSDPRLDNCGVQLPLVTVVVTSYNYAFFIEECLRSVARQRYTNLRCVVVDDCSRDDSIIRIKRFIASEESGGRFTLVCHQENQGQGGAFATGLAYCEGEFLAFLDADDILLEDFVEVHVRAHLERGPVAFTCSNQYQINGAGRLIAGSHTDLKVAQGARRIFAVSLHEPFWVWATTSSMMFRKAVLDLILLAEVDQFRICADNFVCHFANLLGGSYLIPTTHGCYRRHGDNSFSGNQMIGGSHPTGDMARHPRHGEVRSAIAKTLLLHADIFTRQLSRGVYLKLLAFCATPREIRRARVPGVSTLFLCAACLLMARLHWAHKILGAVGKSSLNRDLCQVCRV